VGMVVYLRFVVTGVIAIVLMLSPVGDTAPAAEPAAAPQVPALPATIPATWLTYHLAHRGPGCAFPGDPNPAYFYKGRTTSITYTTRPRALPTPTFRAPTWCTGNGIPP